jgi:large conductance mechanosensitive channel
VLAQVVLGFELGWQANGTVPQLRRLDTAPLGLRFNYQNFLPHGIAFLILAAIAYVLFIMRVPSDGEPEPDMRECPECKSDIFAEATRCAFCTASLTPLETSP